MPMALNLLLLGLSLSYGLGGWYGVRRERGRGGTAMYHPGVTIGAGGAILDPVYCLPRMFGISTSREGGVASWDDMDDRVIVEPCKEP